jgi:hypothetical protein
MIDVAITRPDYLVYVPIASTMDKLNRLLIVGCDDTPEAYSIRLILELIHDARYIEGRH